MKGVRNKSQSTGLLEQSSQSGFEEPNSVFHGVGLAALVICYQKTHASTCTVDVFIYS